MMKRETTRSEVSAATAEKESTVMAEKTAPHRSPDEAPIAPARLHHIAFRTARFQEMREFYLTFLGVHPTLDFEGFAFFSTFDLAHHRLVLFHNPSSPASAPQSPAMPHC